MTHVDLSFVELLEAAHAGVLRRFVALKNNTRPRYGFHSELWQADIEGACAERLVAKHTGKYWIGALAHKDSGGDVGDDGVRWTKYDDGCLLLHHEDADEQLFVLVTGRVPRHKIVGAIRGSAGKREEFWSEDIPRPCFMVPQSALDKSLPRALKEDENG